jgi:hypothetical protein
MLLTGDEASVCGGCFYFPPIGGTLKTKKLSNFVKFLGASMRALRAASGHSQAREHTIQAAAILEIMIAPARTVQTAH